MQLGKESRLYLLKNVGIELKELEARTIDGNNVLIVIVELSKY